MSVPFPIRLAAFLLLLPVAVPPAPAEVIRVQAGEDLQAALDRARPGDTILLEAGATFTGNFVLRPKTGPGHVTVRSSAPDARLPGEQSRIGPADAALLPKLQSPNTAPALRTEGPAHRWRLQFLHFLPNLRGAGDIIRLGDGSSAQHRLDQVPHDLLVDRCYIQGDPGFGQKRGIALNSGRTTIKGSYIAGIKVVGQDSQAIGGWNGPGPYLVANNYLEAAGENFMLGGSDPAIPGLVPTDIVFTGNHLSKPLDWRGTRWTVKNLFELKNARKVLVEGNLFEHNWRAAQVGYAVLFKSTNQSGRCDWCVVEDVTFRYNIVRHVAAAVNILGSTQHHPSERSRRIRIAHNLFYDVDGGRWGGNGFFLLIGGDRPSDVIVEHNTIIHSGNVIAAYGGTREAPQAIRGFVFRNNLARHNRHGVHGAGHGVGQGALKAYFPDGVFERNVLAGGSARRYPPGNFFPSVEEFEAEFVDFAGDDYRLAPSSRFRGAGTDGGDLGADVDEIMTRVRRAAPAPSPREPEDTVPLMQRPPESE